MDKTELLKSVLQSFINDKTEEAKADFHKYLTLKSKEITGIGASSAIEAEDDSADEVTNQISHDQVEQPNSSVTDVVDTSEPAEIN